MFAHFGVRTPPSLTAFPIGSFGIVVWVQAITAVSLRASKQDAAIFDENFT